MAPPVSPQALVADIGGTNARFALAERAADGLLRLIRAHTLRSSEFHTLADAVEAYFKIATPEHRPRIGAAAVAGPIAGDRVSLTNQAWTFSIAGTRRQLRLDRFEVMNDFAAIARSLPHLQAEHLHPIGVRGDMADRTMTGVMAVVGPGTGLGVGALVRRSGRLEVIASEGGHIGFAPGDEVEAEIGRRLLDRYPRVSYERLVSGPGLGNLYRALAGLENAQAEDLKPADIVERAIAGTDDLCRHALERFCAILGAFAGDVALMFRAGRVYIAGGMAPRFPAFLEASAFRARFEAKGRYGDLMRRTPTDVILHEQPGLLGAAAALFATHDTRNRAE